MGSLATVLWLVMVASDITLRRAGDADIDGIISLGAVVLGWAPGEPHEELFRWKHAASPFGPSPMWVAESDGALAGFRAFMRWELVDGSGRAWRAVRAVDTATCPDFQRRGVFRSLTMRAVREMEDEGVDIVFNTPNSQSRPGYLKMGWVDVGRVPVSMRPTSLTAVGRLARARTAAAKWSEPSEVGVPAAEALAEADLAELLLGQPAPERLATALSVPFLAWRYGLDALHYRAWAPHGVRTGLVLFRVRRRGSARECSVCLVLTAGGDPGVERHLLSTLAAAVDADYLLRTGGPDPRSRFVPLPGQGPRLTARAAATAPPCEMGSWDLRLGDVELF